MRSRPLAEPHGLITLTMVGKLQLANIEPGSTYMNGATGPLDGGRLLFGNDHMPLREVDTLLWSLIAIWM